MPTAPDEQVFIRWLSMKYLGLAEDLRHEWLIDCVVTVAGEQVFTTKLLRNSTIDAFEGKFLSALEEKRLEYVSE